jgi:predicted metal-binding membrane protein
MSAQQPAILPLLLRRDRLPPLLGLLGVALLAWAYLVWLVLAMETGDMSATSGAGEDAMAGMMMPQLAAWSAADWALMLP